MKRKKNEECRESQVTTINIFAFTFHIKNHFFVQKHSLKKVVYTKERLYLRWNEHHLKLMVTGLAIKIFQIMTMTTNAKKVRQYRKIDLL